MEFSKFTELLSKVKKIEVDGKKAHLEMVSVNDFRRRLSPAEIEKREPLNAGVVALFYPNNRGETMFILILRQTSSGVHSRQIGFPGGREEVYDDSMINCALRETHEEIGVRPTNMEVVRELTKCYIPPSNFWVYPYMAIAKNPPRFKRQETEVRELIPVSLEDLMDENNRVLETLNTRYGEFKDVPSFLFNGKIVWGATAMILNEVKSILKEVL